MESEDVSEKIKFDAKRLAAAFGRKSKKALEPRADRFVDIGVDVPSLRTTFRYRNKGIKTVDVHFLESGRWLISLETGFGTEKFRYVRSDGLQMDGETLALELMLALFKLGLDLEPLQRVFNLTLTAHERLEARFAMPRKFWPSAWLDEEESPLSSFVRFQAQETQ